MHEPPVQSDCCALSGNYRLESNPERHEKTPLAAAIGNWDVREIYLEFLKWEPENGYTGRTVLVTRLAQDSYLVKQFPNWLNLRSNHLPRWFFRFQCKRLRADINDLKEILLRYENTSSFHWYHCNLHLLMWLLETEIKLTKIIDFYTNLNQVHSS